MDLFAAFSPPARSFPKRPPLSPTRQGLQGRNTFSVAFQTRSRSFIPRGPGRSGVLKHGFSGTHFSPPLVVQHHCAERADMRPDPHKSRTGMITGLLCVFAGFVSLLLVLLDRSEKPGTIYCLGHWFDVPYEISLPLMVVGTLVLFTAWRRQKALAALTGSRTPLYYSSTRKERNDG